MSLPDLDLRPGDGADLADMMVVMDDAFDPAFGEAWTRAQAHGILGVAGVWLTIARRGPDPVGFALARVVLDEAELLLLAVGTRCRRGGIGRALLDRTMASARTRGAARLHLEMRENNPALLLYRAAGFTEIGRRPSYYRGRDGTIYDALTLSRALE